MMVKLLLLLITVSMVCRADFYSNIGLLGDDLGYPHEETVYYTNVGNITVYTNGAVCDTIVGSTTVTEKADALIFGTNITTNDSGTVKHYYSTDTTGINFTDSIVSLGVKDTITCTTSVLQPSDSIWWWVKFASDTGLCTDLTSKTLAITLDSTVAMDDDWIYRDSIPVVKSVARRKSKWSGWSWDGWGW